MVPKEIESNIARCASEIQASLGYAAPGSTLERDILIEALRTFYLNLPKETSHV